MPALSLLAVLCALVGVARLIAWWSKRDLSRSLEQHDFRLWESELVAPYDQDADA